MEKKYKVGGMACGGCSASVQRALMALQGVENAQVDHINGIATVVGEIDENTVASTIENAGFDYLGVVED
jgi:copper chaperone